MLVRDSMIHRHSGRLRAGILATLAVLAMAGLAALGLMGKAGPAPGWEGPSSRRGLDLGAPPADAIARPLRANESVRESAGEPDQPKAPRWLLQVTILDEARQPVQDALVEVVAPGSAPALLPKGEGVFVLSTGRALEHILTVEGPDPRRDGAAPLSPATLRWRPQPGELETNLEVVLQRAARIVGSLSCADGSSPHSAGIDIFHVPTGEWSNAAAIGDGTFVSSWMPAGEVIVYSRNGGWSDTDLKDREVLTLTAGQSHAFHGELAPAIDLSGTVVDTAGRPLASVSVDVYDERNPAYSESVLSEKDGSFLCDGLYPGTYLLDLPRSVHTPKQRITVPRGTAKVDIGNLIFRVQ